MRKLFDKFVDSVATLLVLPGVLFALTFSISQQARYKFALRWGALTVYRKLSFSSFTLALVASLLGLIDAGSDVLNVQQDGITSKTIVIAKPVQGRTPYPAQVSLFGQRMSLGFGIDQGLANEFSAWILEAAERQKLSPELIASLVLTESSFRKYVVSHVGAVGPTQVRPDYWASFCGATNLKDPEQNVYCGAQVLRHLVDRCTGNFNCALSAYNVGFNTTPGPAAARYIAKIDLHMDWLENAL